MVEPTDDTNAADRLEDAERRLAAIAGLASGPVTPAGTPESNLMDAEARLIQINDIAKRTEPDDRE